MAEETAFDSRALREFHLALTDGSSFGVPRYTTALLPPVATNQGGLAWDTSTNTLKGCDGSAWDSIIGGGTITGPGTTVVGYIPNWADTTGTSLGSTDLLVTGSILTDNATTLNLTVEAANPTAAASTTAGRPLNLIGSDATAGTANNGAEAGGNVSIGGGAAARRVSGDAIGGSIILTPGAGTGTGLPGSITLSTGSLSLDRTITTAGTTGNRTIDKMAGTVNIAANGTTVTVTNKYCTASSLVFAVVRTNDLTARIANVVPGVGSFVINIVACTAEVSIGFWLTN